MTRESSILLAMTAAAVALVGVIVHYAPFDVRAAYWPSAAKPVFGWVSLVMVAVSAVYSLRKRELLQFAGSLQAWRWAHVGAGLALLAVMFLHSGGAPGHGAALAMSLLAIGLAATGLYGIAIQGFVPKMMTRTLQDPVYKSEMQDDVNEMMGGISSRLRGRTPAFQRVYQRHILPALMILRPSAE